MVNRSTDKGNLLLTLYIWILKNNIDSIPPESKPPEYTLQSWNERSYLLWTTKFCLKNRKQIGLNEQFQLFPKEGKNRAPQGFALRLVVLNLFFHYLDSEQTQKSTSASGPSHILLLLYFTTGSCQFQAGEFVTPPTKEVSRPVTKKAT